MKQSPSMLPLPTVKKIYIAKSTGRHPSTTVGNGQISWTPSGFKIKLETSCQAKVASHCREAASNVLDYRTECKNHPRFQATDLQGSHKANLDLRYPVVGMRKGLKSRDNSA